MRRSIGLLLSALWLTGCAAAQKPATGEVEQARAEAASLAAALDVESAELFKFEATEALDCPRVCELSRSVCDLASRICALAEQNPRDTAIGERCRDGKERCQRGRLLAEGACPACASP